MALILAADSADLGSVDSDSAESASVDSDSVDLGSVDLGSVDLGSVGSAWFGRRLHRIHRWWMLQPKANRAGA